MPCNRTYRCPQCRYVFKHYHERISEGAPPCPHCKWQEPAWVPEKMTVVGVDTPRAPRIAEMTATSDMDRAVKITEAIAEKQFGMTNMNDSQREGDAAFKLTPDQAKTAETFWGGEQMRTTANGPPTAISPGNILSMAAGAMADARAHNADPIGTLHRRKPRTSISPAPSFGKDAFRLNLGVPKDE